MNKIAIPEIAKGYEDIYRRFAMGKLIYKPDPNSDNGKIEFPIRDLANPLEGAFDLTGCGESNEYLSISTGYRKGKEAQNTDKVEIWITPRFLIEKEINSTAAHFQPIMDEWRAANAPVGVFWTWGDWDDLNLFDYLVNNSFDQLANNNLYRKWGRALERADGWHAAKNHPRQPVRMRQIACFICEI
jgi:hypothetical protein